MRESHTDINIESPRKNKFMKTAIKFDNQAKTTTSSTNIPLKSHDSSIKKINCNTIKPVEPAPLKPRTKTEGQVPPLQAPPLPGQPNPKHVLRSKRIADSKPIENGLSLPAPKPRNPSIRKEKPILGDVEHYTGSADGRKESRR